jgi:hypothetical protein
MIGRRGRVSFLGLERILAPRIIPCPTGRMTLFIIQAFHAWLPSFSPSGTKMPAPVGSHRREKTILELLIYFAATAYAGFSLNTALLMSYTNAFAALFVM